jgi:hypothetical protein
MPLSQEQLEQVRQTIRQRREQLEAELRSDAARTKEDTFSNLAGPAADPGDESVADLIGHLDSAEMRRDEQEMRQLAAAEGRLSRVPTACASTAGGTSRSNGCKRSRAPCAVSIARACTNVRTRVRGSRPFDIPGGLSPRPGRRPIRRGCRTGLIWLKARRAARRTLHRRQAERE